MPSAFRVQFVAGRTMVAVSATVNHATTFILLVDTGAQRTIISTAAAQLLGVDLARPLRREGLAGVGRTLPVPVVRLDHLQVGGAGAGPIEASVFDLPPLFACDGLIGLNFLRRFRVTLEFDTRTLVFRPLRIP